tara:strand:- start:177 stop:575 length:399 start_codon:yes stop_codon:yes gene_type:complete
MGRESHEQYMKRRMKELNWEEYTVMAKKDDITPDDYSPIVNNILGLANQDVEGLHSSEQSYGDSWKQRGGVGAFMMLARKWDRLEKQVNEYNYDVFLAAKDDMREEGILDDIRDLRRYLFLVEAEVRMRGNG